MSVSFSSRFSVLKLEDDDIDAVKKNQCSRGTDPTLKNKNQKPVSSENKKPKKKKKCFNEIAELQSLAFANQNSKTKHKSTGSAKNVQPNLNQWEEWKQKDNEFVSETYEQDLQEALLLSKIDYEEKKDVYEAFKKESDQNKQGLLKKKRKNNQKKEGKLMTLNEFQHLTDSPASVNNDAPNTNHIGIIEDTEFFSKIEEDAEIIISKEHKQDQIRASIDHPLESVRVRQYQEDLRKRDEEIALLNDTVNKLKEELKSVKSRNRKLYGILESAEMREKAEILIEKDQLICERDDLTKELSEYHTSLEQERSKVHSLQMELKKCQNTKKQRTESK